MTMCQTVSIKNPARYLFKVFCTKQNLKFKPILAHAVNMFDMKTKMWLLFFSMKVYEADLLIYHVTCSKCM